jgi:transposase
MVVDGAISCPIFLAFVQQVSAPMLSAGDLVMMHNPRSHTVVGVSTAIEAAGVRALHLPPYGPDLNAIERASRNARHGRDRPRNRRWKQSETPVADWSTYFPNSRAENHIRHCTYYDA